MHPKKKKADQVFTQHGVELTIAHTLARLSSLVQSCASHTICARPRRLASPNSNNGVGFSPGQLPAVGTGQPNSTCDGPSNMGLFLGFFLGIISWA